MPSQPKSVPLPAESRLLAVYDRTDLADAYSIALPRGTSSDPELLARFVFSHQPRWVAALMAVRDTVVAGFGLKTGRSLRLPEQQRGRIGIFRVYETSAREVIMGEDDKHLDFRASVFLRPASDDVAAEAHLVLSTVVHCHNLLGRSYLRLIAPFHRMVVQAFLRSAAKAGWPRAPQLV